MTTRGYCYNILTKSMDRNPGVNTQPLIKIEDVATSLGVSVSSVRRWIRSGVLTGQRAGGQWRFNRADVEQALVAGRLALPRSSSAAGTLAIGKRTEISWPFWAQEMLTNWREFLSVLLERIRPQQVVVVDRRGAGIFSLLGPWKFEWGKTLWRSMAVDWMPEDERRTRFGGKTVLVFDEMIQHGRQMARWRKALEDVGAQVFSAALIRSHEHHVSGELRDRDVIVCEDLEPVAFGNRAADLARFLKLAPRPLDVDHLIVRGELSPAWNLDEFILQLSRVGTPFIVQEPEADYEALAVTLDRPDFFDVKRVRLPKGLAARWNGPFKIRFYLYPKRGTYDAAFIALPTLSGTNGAWVSAINDRFGIASSLNEGKPSEEAAMQLYSFLTFEVSAELARQFRARAETLELGLSLPKSQCPSDRDLLIATYGERRSKAFIRAAEESFRASNAEGSEPPEFLAPSLRAKHSVRRYHRDLLGAGASLLSVVPRQFDGENVKRNTPVTYVDILSLLPRMPEPLVSFTLDNALDFGTLKPTLLICDDGKTGHVTISRAFWRGEYFGAADYSERVQTDLGLTIQRTLGVCYEAVSRFISITRQAELKATHFTKLFSNLTLDWNLWEKSPLYLSTRPRKYGLVPTVPHGRLNSDNFESLSTFLIQQKCLAPLEKRTAQRGWKRFRPLSDGSVDWNEVYRITTDGTCRSMVKGLVRLYATIQDRCKPVLPSISNPTEFAEYSNPLTVLGSVRNRKVAYICGHYEVSLWISQGREYLFPLLANAAAATVEGVQLRLFDDVSPIAASAHGLLGRFAEPAKQLAIKLDMYRNIGSLRKSIADLSIEEDLDLSDLLLETVDSAPDFSDRGEFPIGRLETAAAIMRPFSSLVRQVLTLCGLEEDKRPTSEKPGATPRDAVEYAAMLFEACPQIFHLRTVVDRTIETAKAGGALTREIVGNLQTVFDRICSILEDEGFLPIPQSRQTNVQRSVSQAYLDLVAKLKGSGPRAVVTIETRNVSNLAWFVSDMSKGELSLATAMDSLIDVVDECVRETALKYHTLSVHGKDGDTFFGTCSSADEAVAFCHSVQDGCKRRLAKWDSTQFIECGLVVAGVSWHAPGDGEVYEGRASGIAALALADKSHFLSGTIAITGQYLSD